LLSPFIKGDIERSSPDKGRLGGVIRRDFI
jgi:hypothetical protein